jgi:uncharacterized membrane protein
MIMRVDDYLQQLKIELKGSDPALVQDALADAEEHLRNSLENELTRNPGTLETEALEAIIEKYGSPEEVASAYREFESRFGPSFPAPRPKPRSSGGRFFGILGDARAWGSFLYLLFGLLTGCFYGMWVLFGAGLSIVTLPLIIGLPVLGLFLLSVRAIALMEGRIVEALLGIRMPRKPLFIQGNLSWKARFKSLVTASQTWKSLAYLALQFPLGSLYSIIMAFLFAFFIKCAIYPFWFLVLHRPLATISQPYYPPGWLIPLISLAGCLLLPITLHLAKGIGGLHGRYAKAMLVRK